MNKIKIIVLFYGQKNVVWTFYIYIYIYICVCVCLSLLHLSPIIDHIRMPTL